MQKAYHDPLASFDPAHQNGGFRYSMPAIGRINVHTCAHVGRRRISPMEETAECPEALEVFAATAIDRPGCSAVPDAARSGGMPDGH